MSNKAVNINAILANTMAAFAPLAAGQSTLPVAYATARTLALAANWQ